MEQVTLSDCLDNAPTEWREALEWFQSQAGSEIPWPKPSPVSSLEHVVAQTKGIYKPKDFDFALTVRQTLGGSYSDREVIDRHDGTWVYAYHQEGSDPDARDDYFTNRGLMENLKAEVPVAVLVQTSVGPSRYLVRGLALVSSWSAGFFYLEGFGEDGLAHVVPHRSEDDVIDGDAKAVIGKELRDDLDPDHDARVRVQASVVRRQGQGAFRKALLRAYSGRCAVSGCDVEDVLDAAHIIPYRGDYTDLVSNGILIRTDLHALFDRGLIAIDPGDRTVIVSERLTGSEYASFYGARVNEPRDVADRPSDGSLEAHIDWCANRL
jgi:putative restriction endonuclease